MKVGKLYRVLVVGSGLLLQEACGAAPTDGDTTGGTSAASSSSSGSGPSSSSGGSSVGGSLGDLPLRTRRDLFLQTADEVILPGLQAQRVSVRHARDWLAQPSW